MSSLPTNVCQNCSKKLDRAANLAAGDDEKPAPGDISVCLHCGHMMAFADDLTLRELTAEEAYDVAGNPTVLALQRVRGKLAEWPAKPPDDSVPPSPEAPKRD